MYSAHGYYNGTCTCNSTVLFNNSDKCACVYNDKQYLTSVNLSADKFVLLIIRALLFLQVMQKSVMGFALPDSNAKVS